MLSVGREQFVILSSAIQIGFLGKVKFEQRLNAGKRANHGAI